MTDRNKARILGKVYFSGELVFTDSFVSVSSGQGNESTDSLACRDSGGRLIIPATSFAGVLRHKLENLYADDKSELEKLFGNTHDDCKKCSDIVFTDLYPAEEIETQSMVQQCVKISRKYLSAENKGKYDREIVLNQRYFFFFYIERTHCNREYIDKWKERLTAVLYKENRFFIGGRNSVGNGWGRFHNVAAIDYDFTQPGKLKEFLLRKGTEKEFIEAILKQENHALPEVQIDTHEKAVLQLDYTVTFQDAFLIDDPEAEPDDDEAEFNFLTINGKYTIPGASIKGVFRSRSEMIARTVGIPDEKMTVVFGSSPDKPRNEITKKSNIYFSYAFIQDETVEKRLLDGVSIDRFTGGASEAALFDFKVSMNGTFSGSIILEISGQTIWYLPVLYLVIRDIRGQDLSFGFGRTKGWGRAASFNYTIKPTHLPEPWAIYLKDNDFNLVELEKLHKNNLPEVTS